MGQVALLDTAANNLANVDTNGYQVDRLVFRRAMSESMRGQQAHPSLEYAVTRSPSPDMRAGRIVPTGRELDVAISDDNAFFAVETDQGIRYTRAGNLQVMPDGAIATPQGFPYLGQQMRPLVVPRDAGQVSIDNTGELLIDGVASGMRLAVVEFGDVTQLQKEGNVLLRAPLEAGTPNVLVTPYLQTQALEKATDRAFQHMSAVVDASRNFDILSQVIQAFRDVEKSAARDIHGA